MICGFAAVNKGNHCIVEKHCVVCNKERNTVEVL